MHYPLIQGREAGWPAWTFASMAAALAVLAVFVAVERRRERSGVSPLVTMSLFRKRAFSAGLACALVFFAGMIGLIGMGTLLAPLFNFVLAGVEDDEVGSASGVLNATQQLSGAIGIGRSARCSSPCWPRRGSAPRWRRRS